MNPAAEMVETLAAAKAHALLAYQLSRVVKQSAATADAADFSFALREFLLNRQLVFRLERCPVRR